MIILTQVRRNGTVDLCIVLDEVSIERIKKYDAAEVRWDHLPPEYSMRKPRTIGVAFATKEEQEWIEKLSASRDPDWKEKAFALVTRGFQFHPDLGDHDFGPTVLGEPTKGTKQ